MRVPPRFDSWDCRAPALPPRSRLYSLKPIGIGTPFVESLTGYVSRLADAHAVSVGDLLGRELSTFAPKPLLPFGPFLKRNRPHSHGFHAQDYAVNGFGGRSRNWVDALENATLQKRLRFLTLLPLAGLFSATALFRCTRAWCPECYEHWQGTGGVVYEPLLWAIAPVTVCLLHRQALEEVCPHCHGRPMPIAVYSRPGYCSRCQQWLGCHKGGGLTSSHEECNAAFWQANNIGELFAAAPRVSSPCLGTVFRVNLQACVDAIAEGNRGAFALAAKVTCSTLGCHLSGKTLPQISTVLRISNHLQIPLTAFLDNNRASTSGLWAQAKRLVQIGRKRPLSRTAEHVRSVLEKAVCEQPPPSLSQIAQRLDYRGVERLYQVDASLCKQIAVNYRQSGSSHWWRKSGATRICERTEIQRLLEQSLAAERPLSAHHIAARLGYSNDGYIQQRFPALCRAIRHKIAALKIARLAAMKTGLVEALRESPVPTLHALAKRLGCVSTDTLQSHFPDLYRRIQSRQRVAHKQRIAELRRTLQLVLKESPAPSFTSLCKRVGLSGSSLGEVCPPLCAAIQSRYLRGRREASQKRKEELRAEVRQIVQELHRQGKLPSVPRVTGLLGKTTLREWKTLAAAVEAARQELTRSQ